MVGATDMGRVKRRCPGCKRFIGKRNTTCYWQAFIIFPQWIAPERRYCNHCGRRGLWFTWSKWDYMLRIVYAEKLIELLNRDVPIYNRFRKAS